MAIVVWWRGKEMLVVAIAAALSYLELFFVTLF